MTIIMSREKNINEKMLKMTTMHKKRLFVITDSWRSLRYLVLVSFEVCHTFFPVQKMCAANLQMRAVFIFGWCTSRQSATE